jgi:FkbM family methyltransferase
VPTPEPYLVWRHFDCRTDGFFLEVGANEPQLRSQTWFLEQQGWRGILVEPQAALAEVLRRQRPRSNVFQVACGPPGHPTHLPLHIAEAPSQSSLARNLVQADTRYVRTEVVPVMTLDAILEAAGHPALDFVSIDVEGTQLDVLGGFSLERFRPRLLVIEDHLYSLRVHRFLTRRGYRLVKRTGSNNWYVPAKQPFALTTPLERLRLWKKLWANTPFRKLRVFLQYRRRARPAVAPPLA